MEEFNFNNVHFPVDPKKFYDVGAYDSRGIWISFKHDPELSGAKKPLGPSKGRYQLSPYEYYECDLNKAQATTLKQWFEVQKLLMKCEKEKAEHKENN